MKLISQNNLISKATSRVQGAISERSLAQIGIRAEKNKVVFFASDRMLAIYSNFEAQIPESGTIFVPAKLFTEVVRELPAGEVSFETQGSWLIVHGGENNSYTMKIPLVNDLTWKEVPETEANEKALVDSNKLSYLIGQVSFCISQDSPRNYGSVAYLQKVNDKSLRLVGTDGYRLSYCDIETDLPKEFLENGLCISKRALSEMSKICQEGFEKVELSISKDATILCAKVEDYQMFIRLSAIKYPNYRGVIPKDQPSALSISRSHLQSVTKRVLIAADKTKALLLSFSQDSLTLSSKTMGSSEGSESVSLDGYKGNDCQIAVNGKFLSDVFSTTASETLDLQFKNNEDPIVIVPSKEPNDCISRHVIVPIRESH